jgi:HlyD family secretion protein
MKEAGLLSIDTKSRFIMKTKYIFLVLGTVALLSCNETENRSDAYGNFEAVATTISAETNGKLLFFNVEEGQRLEAGSKVALVDTLALVLQKKQIEARIGVLPQKLRNTIADIEVLKNQKANLERERDRVSRLVAKKAATSKQFDDLQGMVDVVEKQIVALRSQTQTGNRAILSEKQPLLAQVELINDMIRKSHVYNPVNGTVLTKLAEAYEIVGPGAPLYRIGQLDTLTLRFYIDAVQLQNLKIGQEVEVLVDKGDEEFDQLKGKVSWISEEAEFTPKTIQTKKERITLVYAVKAKVANAANNLKIGMPAEINFIKREQNTEN